MDDDISQSRDLMIFFKKIWPGHYRPWPEVARSWLNFHATYEQQTSYKNMQYAFIILYFLSEIICVGGILMKILLPSAPVFVLFCIFSPLQI